MATTKTRRAIINPIESQKSEIQFNISADFFIFCLLRGMFPEIAIQLAFSNPAFKTPFTEMIHNQIFFARLTHHQQLFYIIECMWELINRTAKEREEYLHQLENEQYDDFIKRFNKVVMQGQNNSENSETRQTADLIQLHRAYLEKMLSKCDELIQQVKEELVELVKRRDVIEREIAAKIAYCNNLHLGILARILTDVHKEFSEETLQILRQYNIKATGVTITKERRLENYRQHVKDHPDKLLDEADYGEIERDGWRKEIEAKVAGLIAPEKAKVLEIELSSDQVNDEVVKLLDLRNEDAEVEELKKGISRANELTDEIYTVNEKIKEKGKVIEEIEKLKAEIQEFHANPKMPFEQQREAIDAKIEAKEKEIIGSKEVARQKSPVSSTKQKDSPSKPQVEEPKSKEAHEEPDGFGMSELLELCANPANAAEQGMAFDFYSHLASQVGDISELSPEMTSVKASEPEPTNPSPSDASSQALIYGRMGILGSKNSEKVDVSQMSLTVFQGKDKETKKKTKEKPSFSDHKESLHGIKLDEPKSSTPELQAPNPPGKKLK